MPLLQRTVDKYFLFLLYHLQHQNELPTRIITLVRVFNIVKDIQSYLPFLFYLLFFLLLIVALYRAWKIDSIFVGFLPVMLQGERLQNNNNSDIIKQ